MHVGCMRHQVDEATFHQQEAHMADMGVLHLQEQLEVRPEEKHLYHRPSLLSLHKGVAP
jgi:hypothetical protein